MTNIPIERKKPNPPTPDHNPRNTNHGQPIKLTITINIPPRLEDLIVAPIMLYRRLTQGHPFRRIPLTQGKHAIVDPEDYHALTSYKWMAQRGGRTFYANAWSRNPKTRKKKLIAMHRLIINAPEGMLVDHINHNGLDNRKANLRLATHAQNSANARKSKGNQHSKYKGVYPRPDCKKWCARIRHNKKSIHLGYFDTETQAAKAYDRAAKQHHGAFASLNFPEP